MFPKRLFPGKKRDDEILLVSKPLAPPWNDSGKVYVRDLVNALPSRRFVVLTPRDTPFVAPHVRSQPLYADAGHYRPSLAQNLRVFAHLLKPAPHVGLMHFFFAPNPRTSHAARAACRLTRRPSVQTVLSAPKDFSKAPAWLFGDRVIVLSESTRAQLSAAGFERAVRIYPGVEVGERASPARQRDQLRALDLEGGPIILYPGDLEFSDAASTVLTAASDILRTLPKATVVFACRPKTEASQQVLARLRDRVHHEPRVRFCGEVSDMRALLAASAVVVLPADTTYAKADLPLVLLEALAEGVPVIVSDRPPISEVLQGDVGLAVPPSAPGALAAAVIRVLTEPQRRAVLSRNARVLAETTFSAAAMARAYDRIYAELLD